MHWLVLKDNQYLVPSPRISLTSSKCTVHVYPDKAESRSIGLILPGSEGSLKIDAYFKN